ERAPDPEQVAVWVDVGTLAHPPGGVRGVHEPPVDARGTPVSDQRVRVVDVEVDRAGGSRRVVLHRGAGQVEFAAVTLDERVAVAALVAAHLEAEGLVMGAGGAHVADWEDGHGRVDGRHGATVTAAGPPGR